MIELLLMNFSEIWIKIHNFHWRKCIWKCMYDGVLFCRPQCVIITCSVRYRTILEDALKNMKVFLLCIVLLWFFYYSDVIMTTTVSEIIGVSIVYSTICSGADQRKHQSSAWLAFVRGIHWWPVNSPHKVPVTRKMFLFDDVIIYYQFSMNFRGPFTRILM